MGWSPSVLNILVADSGVWKLALAKNRRADGGDAVVDVLKEAFEVELGIVRTRRLWAWA